MDGINWKEGDRNDRQLCIERAVTYENGKTQEEVNKGSLS
jgi:hypothetical protein